MFGTAREFNGKVQSRHLGTDFDGKVGETIRASNAGVVSLVGELYFSGNMVVINHGEGLATAYLHMSKILVKVGDGQSVFTKMQKTGVIARPMAGYGLPEWIRISVGTPKQNARALTALADALGKS